VPIANWIAALYCEQTGATMHYAIGHPQPVRPKPELNLIIGGLGGGLLATLAGSLTALALARKNRRMPGTARPETPAPLPANGRDGQLALGLFLAGTLGTLVLMTISYRHELALIFGGLALALAFGFGVMGWRQRFGKFVVLTLGGVTGILVLVALAMVGFWIPAREQQVRSEMERALAEKAHIAAAIEKANAQQRSFGPVMERTQEPAYQGRKLLEWLSDVDYSRPAGLRAQANEAIRQMGTNVIPFLLADLGDGNPHQARYERQDLRSPDERAGQATWAFDALGPTARAAIPQLEQLLEITPGYVPSALAGIGRDALPSLLKALTNDVFWVRDNAAAAIANGIYQGKFSGQDAIGALPIALRNLSYTNATNSLFEANTRARAESLVKAIRSDPTLEAPESKR